MNLWNFEWFKIYGYKFFDIEVPFSIRDAGEPGLEFWTIILKKSEVKADEDITDENGCYKFTIKEPGEYKVEEVKGESPPLIQASPWFE